MKNLVLALLIVASGSCAAAGDALAFRITLPPDWAISTRNDVTTYRNAAGTQMLTAATYALSPPHDVAALRSRLLQSIALRREAESEYGSERLALSPVRIREFDGIVRMSYVGEDPVSGRRFVDVTIASQDWLQHFHYEAVGLSAAEFGSNVERLLRDVLPP
jgi:hypothetical protein